MSIEVLPTRNQKLIGTIACRALVIIVVIALLRPLVVDIAQTFGWM